MYALTNCILHSGYPDPETEEMSDRALLINDNLIRDIVFASQIPAGYAIVDLEGDHVAPGFIDLQLNGCGGVMFNDAITSATLNTMHQTNLKSGTTSFLPTLITTSDEAMLQSLELVQNYRQQYPDRVLGLHLEGPYLNPKRKGIHNAAYVRKPDSTMLKTIAAAGRAVVRLITLAPEMVDPSAIQWLTDAGIIVAAGHSDANFEQAIDGFAAGIRMATHLFNAMSPWQGRNPGLVGAIFSHPAVYAGIIADGHHVHYGSIQLAHQILHNRLILVTDATPPAGTQMDSFWIGGQQVFYQNGKCISAEGTLGGSALTMIEAVANCVQHCHISLSEALRMASTYPSKLLDIDHQFGYLAPGYRANLVIFNADFQVTGTIDQGHYVSRKLINSKIC